MEELKQQIITWINKIRVKRGLPPITDLLVK